MSKPSIKTAVEETLHKFFDEYSFGSDETHERWTNEMMAALAPHIEILCEGFLLAHARVSPNQPEIVELAFKAVLAVIERNRLNK